VPVEPTQTAPVEPAQTALVETTQTAPEEATIENHTPLRFQRNAWAKALVEKFHSLMERATTAREAPGETDRHAQFNRVWHSFR
jgi:hypothetical protein